jgi:hypothetical protein
MLFAIETERNGLSANRRNMGAAAPQRVRNADSEYVVPLPQTPRNRHPYLGPSFPVRHRASPLSLGDLLVPWFRGLQVDAALNRFTRVSQGHTPQVHCLDSGTVHMSVEAHPVIARQF